MWDEKAIVVKLTKNENKIINKVFYLIEKKMLIILELDILI